MKQPSLSFHHIHTFFIGCLVIFKLPLLSVWGSHQLLTMTLSSLPFLSLIVFHIFVFVTGFCLLPLVQLQFLNNTAASNIPASKVIPQMSTKAFLMQVDLDLWLFGQQCSKLQLPWTNEEFWLFQHPVVTSKSNRLPSAVIIWSSFATFPIDFPRESIAGKFASCWNKSPPAMRPPPIPLCFGWLLALTHTHRHTTFPQSLLHFPPTDALSDLHLSDSQIPSLTHTAPLPHSPQFAVCLFVYPCWLRNSRSWKLPSLKNTDIGQEINFIPRLKLFFLILAIVTESCKSDYTLLSLRPTLSETHIN